MRPTAFIACAAVILPITTTPSLAKDPDCNGTENWPAVMAFEAMKNAHLLSNEEIDFSKTSVKRISSEKIGKDLWRQVHLVQYYKKAGPVIQAIAVSDASREECSMGAVQTFVISQKL